jgi:hypothetical protein
MGSEDLLGARRSTLSIRYGEYCKPQAKDHGDTITRVGMPDEAGEEGGIMCSGGATLAVSPRVEPPFALNRFHVLNSYCIHHFVSTLCRWQFCPRAYAHDLRNVTWRRATAYNLQEEA